MFIVAMPCQKSEQRFALRRSKAAESFARSLAAFGG